MPVAKKFIVFWQQRATFLVSRSRKLREGKLSGRIDMEREQNELVHLLALDVGLHFKCVLEGYQHQLYTFAYRLTGNTQDAEDIVQEAFVRAYIALETYPREKIEKMQLRPWLYKITLNEFHHFLRRAHLQVVSIDRADEGERDNQLEVADESLETLIVNQDEMAQLIARLPEFYRVVVLCHFYHDLSQQEISIMLDKSPGTVRSAIFRAVRKLRAMLEGNGNRQSGSKRYG
ncbi:MAG: RNA polymerase sigma factor [Ktedonobacteraceae bacterium]|nr:RNA polymerase sigma factor [Ktedonobacteraceae bacterium]